MGARGVGLAMLPTNGDGLGGIAVDGLGLVAVASGDSGGDPVAGSDLSGCTQIDGSSGKMGGRHTGTSPPSSGSSNRQIIAMLHTR